MTLSRQTQKVFGGNANGDMLAVFGSMKTGTPQYSTNLSVLQSQDYTLGWSEAILNDKAPFLEEMNAVQYGLSYQIAYLLQQGVPEWDANTTYNNTSLVQTVENGELVIKRSLVNNNTGNATTNTAYWVDYYSAAILANKADVDLSNALPAQSFINTVMNWGMPDYSAGISISSGYIAPSVGVVYFDWWQNGQASSTRTVSINGKRVGYGYFWGGGGNGGGSSMYALAGKGDTITFTSMDTHIFYPLKGVTNV